MTPELIRYRDDQAGFALELPKDWELMPPPDPSVALIAAEPEREGAFRTNLVLTIETVDSGDLDSWRRTTRQALADSLHEFILLDEENDGHEGGGGRMLFHHLVPDVGAVTAEQWAWLASGHGFTLTASAATFDYDAVADLFAVIADHVHIDRPGEAQT